MSYMIQNQAINYILQNRDWNFVEENGLDETYFSDYIEEFKYIKDRVERYGTVPDVQSYRNIFDKFEYIENFESKDSILDNLYWDKVVRHSATKINEINELTAKDMDNPKYRDKLTNLLLDMPEVVMKAQNLHYCNTENALKAVYKRYTEVKDNSKAHFYSTGLDFLDKNYNGWNKDTEYAIVAGRPGSGKSMLLCRFAAKAYIDGLKVAYYSGEMPVEQTMGRIISAIKNISIYGMSRGWAEIDKQLADFVYKDSKKYTGAINIATPNDFGGYPTAKQLESFCRKCGADILIIDQISLMTDATHAKVYFEKYGNISHQIKAVRDRLNIPVIAANQQNRAVTENGDSDTVQLAGSDEVGRDATFCLFVNRQYSDDTEDKNRYVLLSVGKAREGNPDLYQVYKVDFDLSEFYEVEECDTVVKQGNTKIHNVTFINEKEDKLIKEKKVEEPKHEVEESRFNFGGENVFDD